MTFILTTPVSTGGGSSGATPSSIKPAVPQTIPSNNTSLLDTTANAIAVKWLITVQNPSTDQIMLFEVNSVKKNNTDVFFNRFGEVGDRINIAISVELSGDQLSLNMTNNEPTDITITTLRIIAA